jgi:hypothetical protein
MGAKKRLHGLRSMPNCSPPSSLSLTSRSLENCHGEEEESDEEEGDEDEIEESDGAADVDANNPASSADDAAEPERKADISERLNALVTTARVRQKVVNTL